MIYDLPPCCFCLAEPSDESSEDEPLINLVKKNRTNKQTKNKRKASSPKKRGTAPQKPRKKLVSGKDDEPAGLVVDCF